MRSIPFSARVSSLRNWIIEPCPVPRSREFREWKQGHRDDVYALKLFFL